MARKRKSNFAIVFILLIAVAAAATGISLFARSQITTTSVTESQIESNDGEDDQNLDYIKAPKDIYL